jgi:5-methylcytosine-specific restriction endonuclease McrA
MNYSKQQTQKIKSYLDRNNCVRCNSHDQLTIDHIIPVSFLLQNFGATKEETFDFDNFQSMCRKCNTLKGGRFDLSNPKTKPLLIKYAEKYCK